MNADKPKSTENNREIAKPEIEEEPTPQQEAAFRYFIRINRIFTLTLFIAAVIFVAIFPTVPRIAGLVILAALTAVILLPVKISARKTGFATLVAAGITALVATFARESWPVEPYEVSKWAVWIGAVGVTLILTNKKTGEPNPRFENIAGVLVLFSLVSVTGLVAILGATSTVANPTGLVALEGVAALAEMAGKKWRVRLALAALFPIAALLADHVEPGWFYHIFHP